MGEVALGQFRNFAAVADLAGEQHIPITVAQLDEPVHQPDTLFDIGVTPGLPTVAIKRSLGGRDSPRNLGFAHFTNGGKHFL